MSDEGEESPPPRPRRKIKKIVLASSSSASESDDSGPATSTRKKRLRVLSDEDSESSGSSVVLGSRQKRMLPKLQDSDGDSDTSGWATDHSDAPKEGQPSNGLTIQTSKPASGFASDSSEGNSDKCSICLMRFTNQQVGTPQSCEHLFCLDCITEWSKNVNTCPVDRMTFDFIVVRACAGGRVLCTQPVQVLERVPSMEMLVVEDPTTCEICGNANSEETMLLCDGCDLGFHMECLTPPLTQVPMNQWLCRSCSDRWDGFDVIQVSDVEELFSDMSEEEQPSTSARRPARHSRAPARPAAGSGPVAELPSTSRGAARSRTGVVRRRTATARRTTRRKQKRRRTRTVIIEYELEGNEKCPITKRVKRRVKKRKSKKRQPRTAARRTHVRESVRAALATLRAERAAAALPPSVGQAARALAESRARAGIPALSLFGSARDLDYFSEEEERGAGGRGGGGVAVAARPAAATFAAYRQARRKMVSIPSPTPAASASDVLSTILESQTLLHSKRSVVSISANGDVDIKLEGSTRKRPAELPASGREERVDVKQSSAEGAARKAPSYPGQSRGGGGWGGGYRYPREQGPSGYGSGGRDNGYGGGYQSRGQGDRYQNDGMRRDNDSEPFNAYDNRRPYQYPQGDDPPFDRNRRPENNRCPYDNYNNRRNEERTRHSTEPAPAWRPYAARHDAPSHRNSFGGFENPVDMRMGHAPPPASSTDDPTRPIEHLAPLPEPSATAFAPLPEPPATAFAPLPEPPAFPFDSTPGAEGEEDEPSDSSLVIDTEKYDPTEPTNDDEDSGDAVSPPGTDVLPLPPPPAFPALEPPPLAAVEHILAGIDTGTINVPHDVLDNAVRQVLREHRALQEPPPAPSRLDDRSDEDSDGDCPNFSIYSATSVHIAANASGQADRQGAALPPPADDGFEDLVQGDGDASPAAPDSVSTADVLVAPLPSPPLPPTSDYEATIKRKSEEYNEKVSKRCPITTNTRNPIKIKLNTPSLIRRQVSLYDEEDIDAAAEPEVPEVPEPLAGDQPEDAAADSKRVESSEPEHIEDETEGKILEVEADPETVASEEIEADETSERGETPSVPEELTPLKEDQADKSDGECAEDEDATPASRSSDSPHSPRLAAELEKMTESISETEDERSYTPCLDENRERDEHRDGIEGLDTELISEDDGDEIFSEEEHRSPTPPPAAETPVEPSDTPVPSEPRPDEGKKKKKKDSKKEGKKGKGKKGEVGFKKTSKGTKDRNYRERNKENEEEKRERRDSGESERQRRKKEKRKDLERYDVRTLVTEKRRRTKDAFGRDVSPRGSRSPSLPRPSPTSSPGPRARRASSSPRRARATPSPRRATPSPSPRRRLSPSPRRRLSPSPRRSRLSPSPRRIRLSPSPRRVRLSPSPRRVRLSPSPRRIRLSPSPRRLRASPSPRRVRPSPSPTPPLVRRSASPRRRRRRSTSRGKRAPARRRRSTSRARKRRRSGSAGSPKPKPKKKKRARSERARSRSARRKSPKRKRTRRTSETRRLEGVGGAGAAWSPPSRPASPRTPPPAPAPPPQHEERRVRKRRDRSKHRRVDGTGPSKEVFTSGDNILVSVSFKEQETTEGANRRERRRERRRRRRRAVTDDTAAKPVAIIDLERSPFRELTPSPKNVIVLSDDEGPVASSAPPPQAPEPAGPKTPPAAAPQPAPQPDPADSPRGPNTPPEPPDSPDAYDPYEPTASPSPPRAAHASPPRVSMTLEAAQKTNMSADEVLDRRPLSPIEKVMALLQSTRDVPPDPPPDSGDAPADPLPPPAAPAAPAPQPAAQPAPRIMLPEPTRAHAPKLFLAKPSPIKSDPIKPMQATKISRLPLPTPRRPGGGESPYSPGSSDFGDLFEPPMPAAGKRDGFDALFDKPRKKRSNAAKVPVKLNKKKGKTQVDVKIDDDSLKILDELPSSAVEMQVKSKFLKKLNRQERVVEEVKLVLKPHYNKKHVNKDEYKNILRRTVPKICHNRNGEINPTKIQALVEAYVKKFRKKRKLGLA